ncbi:RNA polymerase sigma factor [Xanthomonas sacchari]|uniref:RNA polymerase sigma factor n=1 Tax=Xanthomonas sacchari TaxID=56458 RepID=UPI0024352D4F|nr:sigma-70 family RNA polymerase sigma factor [Xanthomonas sacchari]
MPPIASLYRTHAPCLHAWFAQCVGAEHAADLTQTTFAQVLERLDAVMVRSPALGEARLRSIAAQLRSEHDDRLREDGAVRRTMALAAPATAPSAQAHACAHELATRICEAVAALGVVHQQVFAYHCASALTTAQIGARLGITPAQVRKHLLRATLAARQAAGL